MIRMNPSRSPLKGRSIIQKRALHTVKKRREEGGNGWKCLAKHCVPKIRTVSVRYKKKEKSLENTLRQASISCQLSQMYFRSWSPTIPTTAWKSLREHLSVKPFVLEENSCRIVRFVALASSSQPNRLLRQPNAQHCTQQCPLRPLYGENRFHPKSNVPGSCMSECSGMSTRCYHFPVRYYTFMFSIRSSLNALFIPLAFCRLFQFVDLPFTFDKK